MNILIIRFSALGDLVTLEPTFRAIRHFYPDVNIDFLTSNIGKGLYEDTNYIDRYIVHNTFWDSIKKLSNQRYDLVFNLHCNSLSHSILFFIRYKKTINISANWIQKLFNIKIIGKNLQKLLENAEINQKDLNPYFKETISTIVKLPYQENEIFFDFKNDNKVVAISTGSSQKWLSKQWGVQRYKELIKKFINNELNVILVGSNLELNDKKIIIDDIPSVVSFVDKTNLTQLKNILGKVDLYIGNDSGPTHIAAAVGTNTFTIFGSTDIKHSPKFGNYLGSHYYIKPSEKIVCHPCYKQVCPTKMECMNDIKVEIVYNKTMEILNE